MSNIILSWVSFKIVVCKAVDRDSNPLRLNGSQDSYSGELQVYINDSWGAFCYSTFSFTSAKVLCKTLGFKTAESTYRINITDTNTPLAVDGVYCYSSVDSFYTCSWDGIHYENESYHYCWDNNTVGIVCSDGEPVCLCIKILWQEITSGLFNAPILYIYLSDFFSV